MDKSQNPQPQNTWQEGKERHLALSAAAADKYDELYEHANFATGSYMKYELDVISKFVVHAPDHSLAVDLGCGTGRDSFLLATKFDQVYAYDFSPEMVRVAVKNALQKRVGNVLFTERDVEDGPLPIKDETIALVNTAFGMGSFVQSPEKFFREVRRILLPRGIAIFSFYNSAPIVNKLALQWRPALAARIIPETDELQVDFEERSFRIAAKAYSLKEIEQKLKGNFHLLEITTFPTLSSLFPQSLFVHEQARQLCSNVDLALAGNHDLSGGPYIVAVCRKGGGAAKEHETLGYERVLELLRLHDIPLDIREHAPARTMEEVEHILQAPKNCMVKSILVAADTGSEEQPPSPDDLSAELFLAGVPADRNLHLGKLATVIQRNRNRLRFANQTEVEKLTGFSVGSIPPFGLPKRIPVILDQRLASLQQVWCGTGKATESLRISVEDLRKISMFSVFDISKPRK